MVPIHIVRVAEPDDRHEMMLVRDLGTPIRWQVDFPIFILERR